MHLVIYDLFSSHFPDFILTRYTTGVPAHKIERLYLFKQFCIGVTGFSLKTSLRKIQLRDVHVAGRLTDGLPLWSPGFELHKKTPPVAKKKPGVAKKRRRVAKKHSLVTKQRSLVAKKHPDVTKKHPRVSKKYPDVAKKHPGVAKKTTRLF